jgi:hypothetical protein
MYCPLYQSLYTSLKSVCFGHQQLTGEPCGIVPDDDPLNHAEECAHITANDSNLNQTDERSGKDKCHANSGHVGLSPKGNQQKGKRKALVSAVVNTLSSDHTEPEGRAREYRRSMKSPSPTKQYDKVRGCSVKLVLVSLYCNVYVRRDHTNIRACNSNKICFQKTILANEYIPQLLESCLAASW